MENLKIYDQVREVPKEAKKDIQAGRLKGKTDINPMWRIKKLTEIFGVCGIGWKYVITKQWIEHGGKDEIAAFVNIDLFVKSDGAWSEAIPGTGGSSFVANEKNGPYVSDECFKMALTDAISVSCKALGFGADVYWDKDSTKYDRAGNKSTSQSRTGQLATSNANTPNTSTEPRTMANNNQIMKCSACDDDITEKIYNYSKSNFGKPLCFKCQKGGK
jgi:hypothetical protein